MIAKWNTYLNAATSLLEAFNQRNITLVEWQTPLSNRLDYPLVDQADLFFLIPDNQLDIAADIATDHGFSHTVTMFAKYTPEFSKVAIRYIIDPWRIRDSINMSPEQRLILLPFSWAGISQNDIAPVHDANRTYTYCTVPFIIACTALTRIICREKRGSRLRAKAICDLCGLIAHEYCDMSYDGDYMELPANDQPLTEKEALEINNAVADIETWESRENESWIKQSLIQILKGELQYNHLPSGKDIIIE